MLSIYYNKPVLKTYFPIQRAWIQVSGKDAERFLQGMSTNHVSFTIAESSKQNGSPVVSAGLVLDTKGRAISPWTFLAWKNVFWLSVPEKSKEALLAHLDRYIIADDVSLNIDRQPENFHKCFFVFGEDGELEKNKIPNFVTEAKDYVGRAHIENSCELWLPTSHGYEVWTDGAAPQGAKELKQDDYVRERIQRAMPEWLQDYNSETLILEMPFESEVSFYKGCYLGQEVVARGTFRGKMPKGLARFEAKSSLNEGLIYVNEGEEERPVGKLSSVYKNLALGLIRFSAAQGDVEVYSKNLDGSKNPILKIEALIGGHAK